LTLRTKSARFGLGLAVAMVAMAFGAASAGAASYPAGGSTFSGSAEGWTKKSAECNPPLFCTADGAYDATGGNPAGSINESSSVAVTALGTFNASVAMESPDFKVGDGGSGTLGLSRQFVPGGLLELTSTLNYTAALLDKTLGTESKAITEAVSGNSPFTAKAGAVPLVAGHTYAIRISSTASANLLGLGLGTTAARFDNVVLSGPGSTEDGGGGNDGKDGRNGGNGRDGITDARLNTVMQGSLVGPAVLKGRRLFVKAKCPASVGRACKVSLLGLLRKGRVATTSRTAVIATGKARQLVLEVKPKAKARVAKKSRLLFKQGVQAGSAKTTVFKRLKLIERRQA
jgi:hypothetical protein